MQIIIDFLLQLLIYQDDWYDSDAENELDLPPWPSNPLNAPLWNSKYPNGGCGKWHKTYPKFHRGKVMMYCIMQLILLCVCLIMIQMFG